MGTSVVKLTAPTAAVATAIAAAQTVTLTATINGTLATAGVATLDVARRVYLQSAGNDSTLNWTVTGTDRYKNALTEVLAGGNTTTVSTGSDFLTVSALTINGTTAGTVTVGTGAVVSSAWIPANRLQRSYNAGIFADGITGKITVERVMTSYDPAIYAASNNIATALTGTGGMPLPDVAAVANLTTITTSTAIADTVPSWAYRLTTVTLNTSTATLSVTQGDV